MTLREDYSPRDPGNRLEMARAMLRRGETLLKECVEGGYAGTSWCLLLRAHLVGLREAMPALEAAAEMQRSINEVFSDG